MAAQIESNQFPFIVEPFNVGPGRALSELGLTQQIRPSTGPSKQAPMLEPPSRLCPGCVATHILYAGQKLCPVVMERIKSPRLCQALDRLLIADAGIYTGREVKYAFKLTHFRALFHYLINRCRTNTLDRRHPVLNPPIPCHKFPLSRVDVRLIHRNSYPLTLLNKKAHLLDISHIVAQNSCHVFSRIIG